MLLLVNLRSLNIRPAVPANSFPKHNLVRGWCCLSPVNNVGRQYTYPMYLGEVPQQELWDIVNINIGATTMMTRMVLEQMKERRKGAIVNVSSASELQPLPLMTVYAASKVLARLRGRFTNYVPHLRGDGCDSNDLHSS